MMAGETGIARLFIAFQPCSALFAGAVISPSPRYIPILSPNNQE
jgi:hypothetical protein